MSSYTAHHPHDALPMSMPTATAHPDRAAILRSVGTIALLAIGLALFVPFWLDALRDMALDLSARPWVGVRFVVAAGATVVIAGVAGLVFLWANLLKRLARIDWA